jgi:hypothetical protein
MCCGNFNFDASKWDVFLEVYNKNILLVSQKSGTNVNFNYFSYFYLHVKVKWLKMALTLDEKVEVVLLSGRQEWCMFLKSEIFVTL